MSSMRMLSIAAVSKTSPAHSMTYRAKWASDCFTFECQLFCGVFGCGKCDLQLDQTLSVTGGLHTRIEKTLISPSMVCALAPSAVASSLNWLTSEAERAILRFFLCSKKSGNQNRAPACENQLSSFSGSCSRFGTKIPRFSHS